MNGPSGVHTLPQGPSRGRAGCGGLALRGGQPPPEAAGRVEAERGFKAKSLPLYIMFSFQQRPAFQRGLKLKSSH